MANHLYLQPVGGHSPSLLWVYSSTHTYTTKSSHMHTHTVREKIGWVLLQISSVYLFNPLQTTREATSFLIWHMGTKPSSHALMHPPTSTDTLASVINKRYMRTFCLPRFEDPDKQVLGRESLCVEKIKERQRCFQGDSLRLLSAEWQITKCLKIAHSYCTFFTGPDCSHGLLNKQSPSQENS